MEKLMKALLVFWGIVFASIALKILSSFTPSKINFSFSDYIDTDTISEMLHLKRADKAEDPNIIFFPLKKQYGLKLQGYKGCIKNYAGGEFEKGYNYSTSSMCMNGECELTVEFKQKIPKKVKLYIQTDGECHIKEFDLPKTLDVVGYVVNLQLSPMQKTNLNIHTGDKVRLEHATGYSISGDTQLYFYDTQIDKDNIMVNNSIVGEVLFNKNASHSSQVEANDDVEKEEELEIPHPETLYTFTCDSHMVCQKEANTYIVNVDGVDFIPSKAFILTCLGNKQANKFCTFFTPLGHTESMKFSSTPMMHSYIDSSKNPEFNDQLKDWEKKRLEKAKEKIESSL